MAMAMARTMTKQQRAKLSWKSSMLKWCYLSTHSHGTHLRVPVPVPIWRRPEGISKPSGGILQDGRPAYSPPPAPPAANDGSDSEYFLPAANYGSYYSEIANSPISASQRYVRMGLLRPWALRRFGPPRWWELQFKKPWRLPPGISDDDRPAPQLCNVGSISNWEGRLKRRQLGHTFRPYPDLSVEDVVANRVLQIAEYFKVPELPDDIEIDSINPEQFEYWLDEVEGYYEFMDLAHELHSIDCLFPLLHHVLVRPRAACIRAKTAQLVTTMVHNNPRSQQLVMELHGLRPLWYNFTSDPDATSRTKALGAISALIQNNKPGITAFRETNGYSKLRDALSSEIDVRLQRESLKLIQYLLHENSSDCITVTQLGLPRIMMHLASSHDAEVRVAALGGLFVLKR